MASLQGHKVEHVDIAMYTLHNVAVRQHKKMLLRRRDLQDVRERVQAMYPAKDVATLPAPTLAVLPYDLANFLGKYVCYKVEWFYMGLEYSVSSEEYKERFKVGKQGNRQIYNKVMDTLGLAKYQTAMNMWLESLYRPGHAIRYEGLGYHNHDHSVHPQVVRMMSHILDYEHVISVTVVEY